MSTVYISNHNESIYAIGERIDEAPEILIEKKYRSKYSVAVKNEKKQLKNFNERATMGPAIMARPEPEKFLRKRNGRQSVPLLNLPNLEKRRNSCSLTAKRPGVPLKSIVLEQQDEKLKHRPKNFIVSNIDAVSKTIPKIPTRRIVVDVIGTRVRLSDGLHPKYIYKKAFGNTPKYIKETRLCKNEDNVHKNGSVQDNLKRIDRDKILAGLKENWADLQKEYQKLPLLTDTIPKILRKQKLENLIRQLESDILLLERHQHIYVYNDVENENSAKNNGRAQLF